MDEIRTERELLKHIVWLLNCTTRCDMDQFCEANGYDANRPLWPQVAERHAALIAKLDQPETDATQPIPLAAALERVGCTMLSSDGYLEVYGNTMSLLGCNDEYQDKTASEIAAILEPPPKPDPVAKALEAFNALRNSPDIRWDGVDVRRLEAIRAGLEAKR